VHAGNPGVRENEIAFLAATETNAIGAPQERAPKGPRRSGRPGHRIQPTCDLSTSGGHRLI
jgi:hypothetical protein